MKLEMASLHNHDEYSLLDGAIRNSEMVRLAREQGLRALAQTNHGNVDGAIRHLKACQEQGLQPIFGCEAYMLLPGEEPQLSRRRLKRHHLTLLVRDQEGFRCIMRALTQGWERATPLNNFPGIPIEQPLSSRWAGHGWASPAKGLPVPDVRRSLRCSTIPKGALPRSIWYTVVPQNVAKQKDHSDEDVFRDSAFADEPAAF